LYDWRQTRRTPEQRETRATQQRADSVEWPKWGEEVERYRAAVVPPPPFESSASSVFGTSTPVPAAPSPEPQTPLDMLEPTSELPAPVVADYKAEAVSATAPSLTASAAEADEAFRLWQDEGFVLLDVRSALEQREHGIIRSAGPWPVAVPMFHTAWGLAPGGRRCLVPSGANPMWLDVVRARLGEDVRVVVMCSDGGQRTSEAVDLLTAEGCRDVRWVRGGYQQWDAFYDYRQVPRSAKHRAAREAQIPTDTVEWPRWTEAVLQQQLTGVTPEPFSAHAHAEPTVTTTAESEVPPMEVLDPTDEYELALMDDAAKSPVDWLAGIQLLGVGLAVGAGVGLGVGLAVGTFVGFGLSLLVLSNIAFGSRSTGQRTRRSSSTSSSIP
jgi:rhodanese-related sulfurtransferase